MEVQRKVIASPAAIGAVANACLWPEPDWIRKAADELGYAWARRAWAQCAQQPGAWFDEAKAQSVVTMWPKWFRLTDDRFAGKPFRLIFWQEVIVRLLVGWKAPAEVVDPETGEKVHVHVRIFRQLRLWIPRKNGKSEFLAALSLLFWAIEGVHRGQGFCFAVDEAQARQVFDKMSDMVTYAPDALRKHIRTFAKYLWIQKRKTAFRLLAAGKPTGKHGRGPQVITGDEMHEWVSRMLMDTLRQGTGTRLQPIELYASTAGPKTAEVGYGLWDESLKIADGTIDASSTLVVIFAAEEDDNWEDEAVWAKANPSLGLSPTIAFLREEYKKAKESPRAEAEFRCFHLNQWIDAIVRWLPKAKWQACAPDKEAWKRWPEELKGKECFLSIDVSATRDLTCRLALFPPDETCDRFRMLCRFWAPEKTIEERSKRDRVDYAKWHRMGAIEGTPGDFVDQDFVRKAVLEDKGFYKVKLIGFDKWNAAKLVTDLQKDGVPVEEFVELIQGHKTLGAPTKEMERLVLAGKFDHGGHPVLDWMAGHCAVRFDENLNFVPARKRSADKIDGIVAAVMSLCLWMGQPAMPNIDEFLKNPAMVA